MLLFDADKFAVIGEEPMTRVQVDGRPLARHGLIRDVWLEGSEDLPYRMISFNARETGNALGYDQRSFNKYLDTWGWPQPIYDATDYHYQGSGEPVARTVKVFTLPEVEAMKRLYDEGKLKFPKGFGKVKAPRLTRRANTAVSSIRRELEIP